LARQVQRGGAERVVEGQQRGVRRLQRRSMRGHRLRVATRHRSSHRGRGRSPEERVERAERQREERGARLRFLRAGGQLEGADRLGEQRHLCSPGEHGCGMVERAPAVVDDQGRQPERMGNRREHRPRRLVRAGDAGGRALEGVRRSVEDHRTQRVQRTGVRAGPERRIEHGERQRAREVRDHLAGREKPFGRKLSADLGDRRVGDREEDQLGLA
jgi:hypothetical protein